MESNSQLSVFTQANKLRLQLDEILSIYEINKKILDLASKDIEEMKQKMLECLYLIEFIKTHQNERNQKTYDPVTKRKIDSLNKKINELLPHLKNLNLQVDIEYKELKIHKQTRLPTLQVIFKNLATQQKILNVLKEKINSFGPRRKIITSVEKKNYHPVDMAKVKRFRDFLEARASIRRL